MNRCPHCDQTHANTNHFCPVTGQPIELGPRLVSTNLLEKYKVLKVIGAGPIGSVLEVEDIATKVHFAAKLIHPQFTRDVPEATAKLMSDMETVSTIECPHIARIIRIGRDTGAAVTVIRELMTGECLSDRIEQVGQFSLFAATKITREILVALNAIHAVNILNHDLSPADIFLSNTDMGSVVKLVDIGERHIKNKLKDDITKRVSAQYYAPEQFDRSRQPSHRSDIYAAGAIFYQMLTGVVPPGDPAPIESFRRDIPAALSQAVMKAISPTANNRFPSAAAFITALDAINLTQPQVRPKPTPSIEPAAPVASPASVIVEMPEIQKHRSRIFVAALVVVLLAVLGGGGYWLLGSSITEKEATIPPVTIKIKVQPDSASITIDGKRAQANPATVIVLPDDKLHTISAKANGFEPMERDVKFDESRVIHLELLEIIQPDDVTEPDLAAAPLNGVEALAPGEVPVMHQENVSKKSTGLRSSKSSLSSSNGQYTDTKQTRKNRPLGDETETTKKHNKPSGEKSSTKSVTPKKPKRFKGFRTDNPFE